MASEQRDQVTLSVEATANAVGERSFSTLTARGRPRRSQEARANPEARRRTRAWVLDEVKRAVLRSGITST